MNTRDLSPSRISHEMAKHSPKSNFDKIIEKMVANSFPDMHVVRELGPGDYFGDLAITNNTNR